MDVEEWYRGLRQIQDRGEIGNAYNGCGSIMSELNDVLDNFYEYILEKYEDCMPLWAEAFIQIYNWQFQTIMLVLLLTVNATNIQQIRHISFQMTGLITMKKLYGIFM